MSSKLQPSKRTVLNHHNHRHRHITVDDKSIVACRIVNNFTREYRLEYVG